MQEWKGKEKFQMNKIKEIKLDEVPLPTIALPKWDGELTFLFFDTSLQKWVTVNAWGHYRTKYPITEEAEDYPLLEKSKVYIGELCAGKNLYDFLRAKKHPYLLFLKIFDVLDLDNPSSRIKRTYLERYSDFQFLSEDEKINKITRIPFEIFSSFTKLQFRFSHLTEKKGFEGIVCHDYGDGIWKVKKQSSIDAVIMGISKDKKSFGRLEVGSVLVGLYSIKGELKRLGRVGSGFTSKVRRELFKALMEGKTSEDKGYVYVKPKIVIEITFNDLVESEEYDYALTFRSPRFKRFRIDKPAWDCQVLHQLPECIKASK